MTRLLLVEDSRGDARLFAEMLRDVPGQPFALTTVATLAEALPKLASHDVVFLDLSLPDAHGLGGLTQLLAEAKEIPIVVLTGNDDDALAVRAVAAGAQDYVKKGEITPALIARLAWYAIERKKSEDQRRRLAISDQAAHRAKLLSSVSAALASSFDLEVTLPAVARLVAAELADLCVIDLIRDGVFTRIAASEVDPAHAEAVACASEYAPVIGHAHRPAVRAIETRRPVELAPVDIATVAPDERARRIADQIGVHSLLAVPLLAGERALGAMTLLITTPGRAISEELRGLAADVAEHIAMGIDNAQHYAAAQRAIRARDELIAVVSHDLRNPLGVISLALQMMEHDASSLVSSLPRAQRAADRMLRLIEDLLDIARIDSGTLAVEPHDVDVAMFLEEAYEQHKSLATAKGVNLARHIDPLVGAVRADHNRLLQAIGNLVGNALKFTPPGGSIRLAAELAGDRVSFGVSDTGAGIASEHLAHIFDRYWQRDRNKGGIGLGLAIVKGIVDAHGGTVEVESTLGIGTTFRITLPGARPARAPSGPTEALRGVAALQ